MGALRGGGAQRIMLNLARGFSERNMRVDVVLANAVGQYLDEVPSGVRIVDLKSERVLTCIPKLITYLRKERPAALLSTLGHANIAAAWASRVSGVSVRLLLRVESTYSRSFTEAPGIHTYLRRQFIKLCYPWSDGIIAPSQGVAQDLVKSIKLPKELIHVIYNPVIKPELYNKAKESITHPWFADGEPPVLISVGRLVDAKDFPTLIRAFAIVRKEINVRLLILGEGEKREMLEALVEKLAISEDISLPGFVKNPYAYMLRSAIYVLSSKWEGLPNSLIEAMALGIPIVATDCESGPREITNGGKYGRLVPVGDENALAKEILEVLKNNNIITPPKLWLDQYSLDVSVSAYLRVIKGAAC